MSKRTRKREDWAVIKRSPYTDKEKLDLCLAPLILQEIQEEQFAEQNLNVGSQIFGPLNSMVEFLIDTIGDEFLVLQKYDDPKTGKKEYGYFTVKLNVDDKLNLANVKFGLLSISGVYINDTIILSPSGECLLARGTHTALPDNGKDGAKEYALLTITHLVYLVEFLKEAIEAGKHPVEVKARTPKQGERGYRPPIKHDAKPWMRGDLTAIVFLDRLPDETNKDAGQKSSKPHQGGSHRSPVFHKRRGHYKVLKAERFKNAKNYRKPIWIQPTWVGKRTAEVGGVTYKVLGGRECSIT